MHVAAAVEAVQGAGYLQGAGHDGIGVSLHAPRLVQAPRLQQKS